MSRDRVALRANCKINWSLAVTGLREDGYHLLDMAMQSVSLGDDLILEAADAPSLTVNGASPGWDDRNLVCRAAALLWALRGDRPGVRIALTKRVPARAGLGGGSADAAAALIGLCALWAMPLSEEKLMDLGLQLGADVPFCLKGGLRRVRGIGEAVSPALDAPERRIVLVMPPDGLDTPAVFRRYDEMGRAFAAPDTDPAKLAAAGDWDGLRRAGPNHLTDAAAALNPDVAEALCALEAAGARYAAMSGSGACCYGVFDDPDDITLALDGRFRVWRAATRPCGVEPLEADAHYT